MKRLSTIIMALVLALGLTQCKKEQPAANELQGETYTINLSVKGNNNAKVDVNTVTGAVDYATGDQIHVASGGKYVGTLTYNGTIFTGNIANAVEGEPLQFYFLGNVTPAEELTSGITESCSVVISDQTQHLPVISGAPSNENFYGEVSDYTAELLNKCALVKFNVTTVSEAATCVTGFNNKVTIDFGENTFSNSQEGNGVITLPAGNGEKWAILLPQAAMTGGNAYAAGDEYAGTFGAVPAIYTNGMFTVGVLVEVTTSTHNYLVDLSTLTGDYEAVDGDTLTGAITTFHAITVAEGATVTLWNASFNAGATYSGEYMQSNVHKTGIYCNGDATIVLEGDNAMTLWNVYCSCITVAPEHTLTFQGTGSLTVSGVNPGPSFYTALIGGGDGACGNIVIDGGNITATTKPGSGTAAIGGGNGSSRSCGNITINGGTVTATTASGVYGAAIGAGNNAPCGDITISGGTVNATTVSGTYGAAIGAGYCSNYSSACGDITITGGEIHATANSYSAAIGAGAYSQASCGDITISGGTIVAQNSYGTAIGGGYSGAVCGAITINGGDIQATGTRGAGIGGGYGSNTNAIGDITITDGTIVATGGNGGAGIGVGYYTPCSNITISGGNVTATSVNGGAGIGGGVDNMGPECGNILISGGTVIANGSTTSVAIGANFRGTVGDITITDGVTSVTATRGTGTNATICIGKRFADSNENGTCGTITIGGTVYPDGATPNQTDGLTFVYPVPTPTLANLLTNGAVVRVTVSSTLGNGMAQGTYNSGSFHSVSYSGSADYASMEMDGSILRVYMSNDAEFDVTFDFETTDNTYMNGFWSMGDDHFIELVSITINGTDVTSLLTNVSK